ncbi:hypothetical protein [Azotobacter salinestris]|uniref:hypothetical protein n=1 Tax=Azotobacter salinestris TaxID=69964 RepID=UPI001266B6B2|nr:hypothetical protein [Azotobacter salinestris]
MSTLAWTDERIAYAMELYYGEGLKWVCVARLMDTHPETVRHVVRDAEQRGMRQSNRRAA